MGLGVSESRGVSKGKSETTSPAASNLLHLATEFGRETTGVRKGLLSTMQEVLKTGGSSVPIISRSVEQSRQEGSRALKDTEANLATSGLSGTPFGEQILAGQRTQAQQTSGQVQQSLAQQIFQGISNFVLGQGQTATSGLSGAIPGMQRTKTKGEGYSQGANLSLGLRR